MMTASLYFQGHLSNCNFMAKSVVQSSTCLP